MSPANSTILGPQGQRAKKALENDRARQTRSKRDRRELRNELKVPRRSSSITPARQSSRSADDSERPQSDVAHNSIDDRSITDSLPQPQRGRGLQEHSGQLKEVLGGVGPILHNSIPDERPEHVKTHSINDNNLKGKVDYVDLTRTELPPPRPSTQPASTKPIQYGSSHHLPFNLNLHPPRSVQPATRREPIRMINSPIPIRHRTDINDATPAPVATSSHMRRPTALDTEKHPVNTYKGSNPVKKLVQNKKLQNILLDKPQPRPRKKPDRMVLKCTGKQEFR